MVLFYSTTINKIGTGTEFLKKVSYPTLATDIYLAERMIDFSDQLSTGIGLAINFDLV